MMYQPMLLTSGDIRLDSDRYSYEVKWDGFRVLIETSSEKATAWSRNGHDVSARYPELHQLRALVETPVILDGEIVCLDDDGNPDFAAERLERSPGDP